MNKTHDIISKIDNGLLCLFSPIAGCGLIDFEPLVRSLLSSDNAQDYKSTIRKYLSVFSDLNKSIGFTFIQVTNIDIAREKYTTKVITNVAGSAWIKGMHTEEDIEHDINKDLLNHYRSTKSHLTDLQTKKDLVIKEREATLRDKTLFDDSGRILPEILPENEKKAKETLADFQSRIDQLNVELRETNKPIEISMSKFNYYFSKGQNQSIESSFKQKSFQQNFRDLFNYYGFPEEDRNYSFERYVEEIHLHREEKTAVTEESLHLSAAPEKLLYIKYSGLYDTIKKICVNAKGDFVKSRAAKFISELTNESAANIETLLGHLDYFDPDVKRNTPYKTDKISKAINALLNVGLDVTKLQEISIKLQKLSEY